MCQGGRFVSINGNQISGQVLTSAPAEKANVESRLLLLMLANTPSMSAAVGQLSKCPFEADSSTASGLQA